MEQTVLEQYIRTRREALQNYLYSLPISAKKEISETDGQLRELEIFQYRFLMGNNHGVKA